MFVSPVYSASAAYSYPKVARINSFSQPLSNRFAANGFGHGSGVITQSRARQIEDELIRLQFELAESLPPRSKKYYVESSGENYQVFVSDDYSGVLKDLLKTIKK